MPIMPVTPIYLTYKYTQKYKNKIFIRIGISSKDRQTDIFESARSTLAKIAQGWNKKVRRRE